MSFGHASAEPSKTLRGLVTPAIRRDIDKLAQAASVNRAHDVKWVGGRSSNGQTVYIDKDIPHSMEAGSGKSYDPARTLPWHEIPEWYLMHELDLPYEDAHKLATHEFEKPRVKALGLDWKKYQEGWGGEIEHNEQKHIADPPKDLDKSPYLEGGKISAKEIQVDPTQPDQSSAAPAPPQDVSMSPTPPQGAPAPPAGPSFDEANPKPNLLEQAHQQHQQIAASYKKLTAARSLLDKVRLGMDSLASLGDMVTHEDIVKEAGKLVAAGMEPSAMASILADMPPEGEALQNWVTQHDQDIHQREAQLDQMTSLVRHEMGTSAMALLSGHHLKEQVASQSGALGPAPSPPMAGAPAGGPPIDPGVPPDGGGNALGGGAPPNVAGMDMNSAMGSA